MLEANSLVRQEASLAALCVSAKIHDTLKKPREILTTAYIIRLPKLASNLQTSGDLGIDPDVRRWYSFKAYPVDIWTRNLKEASSIS